VRRVAPSLLLLLAAVGAWWALAALPGVDDLLLSSPPEVVRALVSERSLLLGEAWVTLIEVLAGLAVALVFGVGAAVLMHLARPIREAAYPLLVASQAVPVLVLAPLLVLAFDFGIWPKVAIVALVCFFPVTVNTLDGMRSVEPDLLKLMRSLDASRLTTLRLVELPASLPYLFSGVRVAASVAVIGAVFGEWAGSESGLGRLVLLGVAQLQTERVYAGVLLLAAMALALFGLATLIERVTVPWNRAGSRA
jgi:ABC-type nitrate/sulfonate/bicarbonate transport system permease component